MLTWKRLPACLWHLAQPTSHSEIVQGCAKVCVCVCVCVCR
jgi:hypothetical protein